LGDARFFLRPNSAADFFGQYKNIVFAFAMLNNQRSVETAGSPA
jgi:hypothetical protein